MSYQDKPCIVLAGKLDDCGEERFLYLYRFDEETDYSVFSYRFSDWDHDTPSGYYILYENSVYWNREAPLLVLDNRVVSYSRGYAWTGEEICRAITDYLVCNILLET